MADLRGLDLDVDAARLVDEMEAAMGMTGGRVERGALSAVVGQRLERCSRCGSVIEVLDGEHLRRIRRAAGLGLREFARSLGRSAPYISDVELNRRRVTPSIKIAYEALVSRKP